jgi:cytochrome c peroxidase
MWSRSAITPGPPPDGAPPVRLDPLDRGPGERHFRSDGAVHRRLRGLRRGDAIHLEIRRGAGGQREVHAAEQLGYDLFRGKAQCNFCHRDGGPGEDPLFTDFTASNIGTPANPRLPYYAEQRPDLRGYVANPAGSAYVDGGVAGNFLADRICSVIPHRWIAMAQAGAMGQGTLPGANAAQRRQAALPGVCEGLHGHNGYFHSLKEIVHFYNTRDVLPRCQAHGDPGKGRPAGRRQRSTANMNTSQSAGLACRTPRRTRS